MTEEAEEVENEREENDYTEVKSMKNSRVQLNRLTFLSQFLHM